MTTRHETWAPTTAQWSARRTLRALLVCVAILASCGQPEELPDVILLTLDTVNLARTPFGDPTSSELPVDPAAMPHLSELLARGQRLLGSHTTVPLTLPSHVSMLTGDLPPSHGVLSNRHLLAEDRPSLALPGRLARAGFATAAFVSLGVLNATSGLDRSFETFDDGLDREETQAYRRSPDTMARVEAFLDQAEPSPPLFLWVHLADPHEPYLERLPRPTVAVAVGSTSQEVALQVRQQHHLTFELQGNEEQITISGLRASETPVSAGIFLEELRCRWQAAGTTKSPPGPTDGCAGVRLDEPRRLTSDSPLSLPIRTSEPGTLTLSLRGTHRRQPLDEVDAAYRSELELLDESIGRLVTAVAARERPAIWAVLSDHGEGLGEHGVRGHAEMVWEEQLETLFALVGPGISPGQRPTTGVLHSDLTPTLIDLLGDRRSALRRALGDQATFDGTSLLPCLSSPLEAQAVTAACAPRRSWSAYALRHRSGRLVRTATYAWPLKAVWQRGRRQQIFDLWVHPAEDVQAERHSPQSIRLRAGANEAMRTWRDLLSGSPTDHGDEARRRLLERLGYL